MTARLLILGGTGEASALAREAASRFGTRLQTISSLAGRTASPAPLAGEVRIGGFGGPEGLTRYLGEQAIDLLVDATHPFASQISHHGRLAAEAAGIPRLTLRRPVWRRHPLDRWVEVADIAGAADALPKLGRRAWMTVGAGELARFGTLAGIWCLVRTVDPPACPLLLAESELLLARGPFNLDEERRILARYQIDVLVTKASGGQATAPKLVAAREASIPVLMIRRPPPEPGPAVGSVEAALDWLALQLNQGQLNQRQLNQGQLNQGQLNQGQLNQGQPNQDPPDMIDRDLAQR